MVLLTKENIAAAVGSLGTEYKKYAAKIIEQGVDGPCLVDLLESPDPGDFKLFLDDLGASLAAHRTRLKTLFNSIHPRVTAPVPLANPVHEDANERALWLKACLILEACTKGVKPFVAKVMQRLHSRVVENVKQDVARDVGACDDEDWNCSTCGDADDVKFTENGPVALDICTMDSNGVADCQTAHYLKPYLLKPCRLRNIPSDCFSPSDNISPASPVLICPNPPDIDQPDCSTFILTHAMHLPVGSHLAPFVVARCQPSEPALQFHAVLCCSRPGHTAALVKSFRLQQELPEARGELSFAFWSLTSRGSEFYESKHGVKKGHVLRFEALEDSALPPGMAQGRRYLVTDATDFSFNICGPIISPVSPMTSQSFSADGAPLVVIRRSPIGR